MAKIISAVRKLVLDILFPPVCLNCGTDIPDQKRLLCGNCLDHIRCFDAQACPECGARIPGGTRICHPNALYALAAAVRYEEPVPRLIRQFKYRKLHTLEFFLSALLIAYVKSADISLDEYVCAAIPLHAWKERVRGFNQADLLARRVAGYFSLPYVSVLKRTAATAAQATLPVERRRTNVAGCFSIRTGADVRGKKILLVDDVSTSGATLREACAVLRKHGARSIICLVIAKA